MTHDDLWWLHEGNRALRVGDWKIVAAGKDGPWELYDLGGGPRRDPQPRGEASREAPRAGPAVGGPPGRILRARPARTREEADGRHAEAGEGADPAGRIVPRRGAAGLHPAAARGEAAHPAALDLLRPDAAGLPDEHEKWMHEQFLAAGVAVAGIDVGEAYGSPKGRELFTAFYHELTGERGFAARPACSGAAAAACGSRAGPPRIRTRSRASPGIYPVFDLRTYPGLDKAAPAYGLSPEELEARLGEHNPIERVGVLAKAPRAGVLHPRRRGQGRAAGGELRPSSRRATGPPAPGRPSR